MWKWALSLCLLTTLANSYNEIDVEPQKFAVAVWKGEKFKCLGVVVGQKYIATSANCVSGSAASSLSVETFASGNNPTVSYEIDTEAVPKVQRVFVHPYYTPPSPDYDIALLKTDSAIANVDALPLGKTEPPSNGIVKTVYWDPQNSQILTPPNFANVRIEDRKSCKEKVGKFVSGRMICAYNENPSLQSDGPLIFDNKLIGIPSRRFESNQRVLPTIYTNIANSEIYSFIESYT